MNRCVNKYCHDLVQDGYFGQPKLLCLSCRHLARWMFGTAVFIGGLIGGALFKLLTKAGWF